MIFAQDSDSCANRLPSIEYANLRGYCTCAKIIGFSLQTSFSIPSVNMLFS